MQSQAEMPEISIKLVIDRIFQTRRITRADQERFMSALLSKKALSDAEKRHIDRVFDGLRNGLIRVVD